MVMTKEKESTERKSKKELPGLIMEPTGAVHVVIELHKWGPITFSTNDNVEFAVDIFKAIAKQDISDVAGRTALEEGVIKGLIDQAKTPSEDVK